MYTDSASRFLAQQISESYEQLKKMRQILQNHKKRTLAHLLTSYEPS
jgi:hypothetical protein